MNISRTTSMMDFWYLYCYFWCLYTLSIFNGFFGVSVVYFEQINASRYEKLRSRIWGLVVSLCLTHGHTEKHPDYIMRFYVFSFGYSHKEPIINTSWKKKILIHVPISKTSTFDLFNFYSQSLIFQHEDLHASSSSPL